MSLVSQIKDRAAEGTRSLLLSLGLLVLRVGMGGLMIYAHGWDKLWSFREKSKAFGDPLNIGPTLSLGLATFAEFFCAVLVVVGLATRFAAIPLAVTMGVAGFIHHAADPWKAKELAFVYLVAFLALTFTGAGRFSIDALLLGRRRRRALQR
jgi:putative oxidoreductase